MQVGKYQLIHKLATGGMAEVFLAKAAGPRGFEKLLVLKRILPHLASEPSFVEMFLSEARLAAQLNHPNVVQIFDFGEADGTYFLAMEYIDGPNLREIIRRASGLGLAMPIALCARIIAAACEGLAFAHNFWDLTTGQELNIVHRDISPDNILLSRQGGVKVVDFGIAKAAGLSPHTQTGVLKGKLSYMPPEYLRNESLDGRVDVYSLGVVFYELLTGQRPFNARSEAGMVQAILYEAPVPVVQRRQEVPQAVQRILAKALAKERDSRYLDCVELQEDLEEFIVSTGKPVGSPQLAQLVAMMMAGAEVPGLTFPGVGSVRMSSRYASLLSGPLSVSALVAPAAPRPEGGSPPGQSEPPVPDALAQDMEPTAVERPTKPAPRFIQPEDSSALPLLAPLPEPAQPPAPLPASTTAPSARKSPPWAALAGVVLFLAGGGYVLGTPPPPPPPSWAASSTDAGTDAKPLGDGGVPPGQSADGGTPPPPPLPPSPPPPPPPPPPPSPPPPEDEDMVENGTLVLQVDPPGTVLHVFMGPFKVGTTPLPPRPMPPGSYRLELKDDQRHVVATRHFVVKEGRDTLVRINLRDEKE